MKTVAGTEWRFLFPGRAFCVRYAHNAEGGIGIDHVYQCIKPHMGNAILLSYPLWYVYRSSSEHSFITPDVHSAK